MSSFARLPFTFLLDSVVIMSFAVDRACSTVQFAKGAEIKS